MPDQPTARTVDRHRLYEASVQNEDHVVRFLRRVYRNRFGRGFTRLREDFCGTALVACDWVRRHPSYRAWGIDLDEATLAWAAKEHVSRLGAAADRLALFHGDVLHTPTPPADVVTAFNFSYCVFKARETLLQYFRAAHAQLRPRGLFVCDLFGGFGAMRANLETRKLPATIDRDGVELPPFTYEWEQARFNPISHDILCRIHFAFRDGSRLDRAFEYDWRLWTLPELQDLLREAGFDAVDVYLHGWNERGESDDVYRLRTCYENEEGWLAYIVGVKGRR
jgi:SAM-dependent methyltransferase